MSRPFGTAAILRGRLASLGVATPVRASEEDIGAVVGADGVDLCIVDIDGRRADRSVGELAALIAEAVNALCGHGLQERLL